MAEIKLCKDGDNIYLLTEGVEHHLCCAHRANTDKEIVTIITDDEAVAVGLTQHCSQSLVTQEVLDGP